MHPLRELAKKGLYSPEQEHDACGVGVVANIKGQKTHQIIDEGVQVLINLGHRGACGADPQTRGALRGNGPAVARRPGGGAHRLARDRRGGGPDGGDRQHRRKD